MIGGVRPDGSRDVADRWLCNLQRHCGTGDAVLAGAAAARTHLAGRRFRTAHRRARPRPDGDARRPRTAVVQTRRAGAQQRCATALPRSAGHDQAWSFRPDAALHRTARGRPGNDSRSRPRRAPDRRFDQLQRPGTGRRSRHGRNHLAARDRLARGDEVQPAVVPARPAHGRGRRQAGTGYRLVADRPARPVPIHAPRQPLFRIASGTSAVAVPAVRCACDDALHGVGRSHQQLPHPSRRAAESGVHAGALPARRTSGRSARRAGTSHRGAQIDGHRTPCDLAGARRRRAARRTPAGGGHRLAGRDIRRHGGRRAEAPR